MKVKRKSEVAQSCPTLCDPIDYSLPGFSIHGILQARVLEWVAISFSRGSSRPRNQTQVSHIATDVLSSEPPRKPEYCLSCSSICGSELEIVGVLYIIFPRDLYRDDGWSCLLGWDIKQNVRRWTWGMITSGYKQEQKEQAEICEKLLSWEDTQDSNFQGNF